MNLPYFLRPQADRDIDEIADDLAGRAGLDVALLFLQEFNETCALLSTQPEMGWPTKVRHPQLTGARTFRVSERFDKYLIFYVLPENASRLFACCMERRTWRRSSSGSRTERKPGGRAQIVTSGEVSGSILTCVLFYRRHRRYSFSIRLRPAKGTQIVVLGAQDATLRALVPHE